MQAVSSTPMAAQYGDEQRVAELMQSANDPFTIALQRYSDGMTALLVAASTGSTRSMELLLRLPCVREQVEAVTPLGDTALILACRGGHEACVKLLLAAGFAQEQCRATDW